MVEKVFDVEFLIRVYVKMRKNNDFNQAQKLSDIIFSQTGYRLSNTGSAVPRDESALRENLVSIYATLCRAQEEWKEQISSVLESVGVQATITPPGIVYVDTSSGQQLPCEEYERRYLNHLRRESFKKEEENGAAASVFTSPRSIFAVHGHE